MISFFLLTRSPLRETAYTKFFERTTRKKKFQSFFSSFSNISHARNRWWGLQTHVEKESESTHTIWWWWLRWLWRRRWDEKSSAKKFGWKFFRMNFCRWRWVKMHHRSVRSQQLFARQQRQRQNKKWCREIQKADKIVSANCTARRRPGEGLQARAARRDVEVWRVALSGTLGERRLHDAVLQRRRQAEEEKVTTRRLAWRHHGEDEHVMVRVLQPPFAVARVRAVVEGPTAAFGLDVQVSRVWAAGVHHGLRISAGNGAASEVGQFVATGGIEKCDDALSGSGEWVPARERTRSGVVASRRDEHHDGGVLRIEVEAHASLVRVPRIFAWKWFHLNNCWC